MLKITRKITWDNNSLLICRIGSVLANLILNEGLQHEAFSTLAISFKHHQTDEAANIKPSLRGVHMDQSD